MSSTAQADVTATRVVERLRSEYIEMPGLTLTLDQASRLFALDRCHAGTALTQLCRSGFLTRTQAGRYQRP